MPAVNFIINGRLPRSVRTRQLEAMFDVPAAEKCRLEWRGDVPIDDEKLSWNIGLIYGPSGSGKTKVSQVLFGKPREFTWSPRRAVIDDFASELTIEEIAAVCQAVGFNTIPAWMRPYSVLSNGEQFRVDIARHLLEGRDPIMIDEFTSVVDRQVAKIASHAVQKYVRRAGRRFVAVSCHQDIIDWLQPDWTLELPTMRFEWVDSRRFLRGRPKLEVSIRRIEYENWRLFAPFHYLSAELHKAATCFGLFVGDRLTTFAGVLHRPHPRVKNVKGVSRLVTLPDWQGLGLAFILAEKLGAAYRAIGVRLRCYPAHPPFIRNFRRQACWQMMKEGGTFYHTQSTTSTIGWGAMRPSAVFEYRGEKLDRVIAQKLIEGS